ncbi:TPA: hypothetical protein HA351_00875 [Methanosarcinaceae archaeon]|nr:hypothetical protein [Methanosarcinaceae archaeon]
MVGAGKWEHRAPIHYFSNIFVLADLFFLTFLLKIKLVSDPKKTLNFMESYAALIFGHAATDLIKYRNPFSVTVLLSSLSRGVPGPGKFLDRGVLRIISSSKNISGFEFCWYFIGILP